MLWIETHQPWARFVIHRLLTTNNHSGTNSPNSVKWHYHLMKTCSVQLRSRSQYQSDHCKINNKLNPLSMMITIFHMTIILLYTLPWLFLKLASNIKPSYLVHHFNFSKCQPVQPIYFKHSSLVMLFTELLTNIQSCNHVVNTKMVIMGKKRDTQVHLQSSYMGRRGGIEWVAQLYTQQHPVSLKPLHYTEQHAKFYKL